MARVTRSSAASAKLESLDARESETSASSKSRKRQSDARDASPAKRQAAATKQTGKAPKPKPMSKDKPDTALETKSIKASKAANKKEAVPRKSEAELRALRDGPVPEHNPAVAARDPPDQVLYWCMKSEPDVRYEDGYEIKFSIDDLAAKKTPEGWDGIRSYMARNNLRQMKKGDKAFFYHSNCKEPGVIGIVTITNEWSPDWNACINDNPYYDSSAPHDGSKWSLVHVKLEHKFPAIVPLRTLKANQDSGPLKNMQLLKQSRLSVNKVTEEEWNEILRIAKSLADGQAAWDKSMEESKKLPNYSA